MRRNQVMTLCRGTFEELRSKLPVVQRKAYENVLQLSDMWRNASDDQTCV